MTDKLPDNLVQITALRVNRNAELHCSCANPSFEVDTKNQTVQCTKCGAFISPFSALVWIADKASELNRQLERLYEQRKELRAYKPHLIVIRELERQYRGRKMLPCCPRCKKPFYLEKIDSWMNTELAEKRGMMSDD